MINGSIVVGEVAGGRITLDAAMSMACVQYLKGKMTLDEFCEIHARLLCKAAGVDYDAPFPTWQP